jgi:hypothetical protein
MDAGTGGTAYAGEFGADSRMEKICALIWRVGLGFAPPVIRLRMFRKMFQSTAPPRRTGGGRIGPALIFQASPGISLKGNVSDDKEILLKIRLSVRCIRQGAGPAPKLRGQRRQKRGGYGWRHIFYTDAYGTNGACRYCRFFRDRMPGRRLRLQLFCGLRLRRGRSRLCVCGAT